MTKLKLKIGTVTALIQYCTVLTQFYTYTHLKLWHDKDCMLSSYTAWCSGAN